MDKSAFDLFHPTPSAYLRELAIDGPGATESPLTLDAGHFQLETTLASYAFDQESSGSLTQRFEAWSFGTVNLKLGLLNRLDAQIVLEPYQHFTEREDGHRVAWSGFGDTTIRAKYNF